MWGCGCRLSTFLTLSSKKNHTRPVLRCRRTAMPATRALYSQVSPAHRTISDGAPPLDALRYPPPLRNRRRDGRGAGNTRRRGRWGPVKVQGTDGGEGSNLSMMGLEEVIRSGVFLSQLAGGVTGGGPRARRYVRGFGCWDCVPACSLLACLLEI